MVVAAVLAVLPVMAAEQVTITVDRSGLDSWTTCNVTSLSSISASGLVLTATIDESFVGASFDVRVATVMVMEMGTLQLVDKGGVLSLECTSPYYAPSYDITGNRQDGFTVRIVTKPFVLDMNGYQGGWYMNNTNGKQRNSGTATYNLPVVFNNIWVGTFGAHTPLSRRVDGTGDDAVSVIFRGNSGADNFGGVQLDGSDTSVAKFVTIPLAWEWVDASGNVSSVPETFWVGFAGDSTGPGGGNTGYGDPLFGQSGEYVFLPGTSIAAYLFDGARPQNAGDNMNYLVISDRREFTIPSDVIALAEAADDGLWTTILTFGTAGGEYYLRLSYDSNPVPEPAAMSLLALGGLALLRRK